MTQTQHLYCISDILYLFVLDNEVPNALWRCEMSVIDRRFNGEKSLHTMEAQYCITVTIITALLLPYVSLLIMYVYSTVFIIACTMIL